MELRSLINSFWSHRNIIIVILVPLVFLPLPLIHDTKEGKCGYAIIIIAIFWVTEALPIPVTALLPVILFPMLDIVKAKEISRFYLNDTSMLFVGGLILAIAIETWNLHKRIALRLLILFGTEPAWLMLGLMLNTWFLSMWISNTATTAMMMPIAEAILEQLKNTKEQNKRTNDHLAIEMSSVAEISLEYDKKSVNKEDVGNLPSDKENVSNDEADRHNEASFSRLAKAVCLCIAYAANTGGTGTLTGTAPNLVLKAQADVVFARFGLKSPVTFSSWMLFGIPLSIINLFLTWIFLQIFFFRTKAITACFRKKENNLMKQKVQDIIKKEYESLGKMTFAEIMVLTLFITLVVLWITRDLQEAGGWGTIFGEKFVSDSTPAMLIGILLFIIPSEMPSFKQRENTYDVTSKEKSNKPSTLLTWRIVHEKLPWGIVILLGGGFALANASQKSGLSKLISEQLIILSSMTDWVMNMVLAFIVAAATEVTSNTATATLLMPIMSQLAIDMNVNPLYLMFPAALACSFAFMLPVATPPNAIAFSGGRLKVSDMASAGCFVNIICVLTLTLAVNTWGYSIFGFENLKMNTTTPLTIHSTTPP